MKTMLVLWAAVVVLAVGISVLAGGYGIFRNIPCCCVRVGEGEAVPPGANVIEYYGDPYICSEL
jgi:hypothetical protein